MVFIGERDPAPSQKGERMLHDEHKKRQREAIRAECQKRGITVARRGNAFSLSGPGVSILAADLANLDENDLRPCQPQARRG